MVLIFFSSFLALCSCWTFRAPLVSAFMNFLLTVLVFWLSEGSINVFFCISFPVRQRKESYSMITREMHMVWQSCCWHWCICAILGLFVPSVSLPAMKIVEGWRVCSLSVIPYSFISLQTVHYWFMNSGLKTSWEALIVEVQTLAILNIYRRKYMLKSTDWLCNTCSSTSCNISKPMFTLSSFDQIQCPWKSTETLQ